MHVDKLQKNFIMPQIIFVNFLFLCLFKDVFVCELNQGCLCSHGFVYCLLLSLECGKLISGAQLKTPTPPQNSSVVCSAGLNFVFLFFFM